MPQRPNRILGLDFGGTKLAAGVLDCNSGTMACAAWTETRAALGAATAVDDMLKLIAELSHAGDWPSVGVSFGGHVYSNQILKSLHVEGWIDYPLERRLQCALKANSVRIFFAFSMMRTLRRLVNGDWAQAEELTRCCM
ncbi:MAG: hypothetical protein ACUVSX_10455 [Aggregatilineales bacterium]